MAAQALPDELSKLIEKHGLTPHEEGGWFRQ
jgi:predicted cupin superfamily sugar epimerase